MLLFATGFAVITDVQKQTAASVPNAKFVPVAGAGHAVFVDAPDAFDKALDEFLQSIEPTSGHK